MCQCAYNLIFMIIAQMAIDKQQVKIIMNSVVVRIVPDASASDPKILIIFSPQFESIWIYSEL